MNAATARDLLRSAARCYLKAGLEAEACRCLEDAEEWSAAAQCHEKAERWHTAGECHHTGGDWRSAARCLERAGSWEALALVLSQAGEREAAAWVYISRLGHRARAEQAIRGLEGWGPRLIRAACRARHEPAGCRAVVEEARAGIAAGEVPVALAERAVWVAEAVGRPDLGLAVFAAARPHLDRRWPGWRARVLPGGARWPWGAIGPEPEPEPAATDLPRTAKRPRMVWLAGGGFRMGGQHNGVASFDIPIHGVWLSPLWMAATPVTQGQYAAVMGENPSHFTGDGRRPVEQVDWHAAARFCNALSRQEGLRPVYDEQTWTWDQTADGYRLPTEAEWEYACRAGSEGAYWFGDDEAGLVEAAWYDANAGGTTQPVGLKLPNLFGLYDVHGNVLEWCWDRFAYGESFPTAPRHDPSGPPGPPAGDGRVWRGGAWSGAARRLRSAFRSWVHPGDRWRALGFRLARSAPRTRFLNLDS